MNFPFSFKTRIPRLGYLTIVPFNRSSILLSSKKPEEASNRINNRTRKKSSREEDTPFSPLPFHRPLVELASFYELERRIQVHPRSWPGEGCRRRVTIVKKSSGCSSLPGCSRRLTAAPVRISVHPVFALSSSSGRGQRVAVCHCERWIITPH